MSWEVLLSEEYIREAVADLARLVTKAEAAIAVARQAAGDPEERDYQVDTAALNIQNFYQRLEELFQQILLDLSDHRLGDSEWAEPLLPQMQAEVPGVRPPVISTATGRALAELWGYQPEVNRIIASFDLDLARVAHVVQLMAAAFALARPELLALAGFLDGVGGES